MKTNEVVETSEELVLREIEDQIHARSDREYIHARAKELRDTIERWGEPGLLALALVGAELAALEE